MSKFLSKTLLVIALVLFACLSFFIQPTQAQTATNCSWEKIQFSTGSTVTGNTGSSYTGGCRAKGLTSFPAANCESPAPKGSAMWNTSYECCCEVSAYSAPEYSPLFKAPDLEITIPGLEKLSDVQCPLGEECEIPWMTLLIRAIYRYAIAAGGIITSLVLMGGGVLWLLSRGDASKIEKAKNLISGSFVGFIILISSHTLLSLINPDLVNLKNITIPGIEPLDLNTSLKIEEITDADYRQACNDSRNGDYSTCEALGTNYPEGIELVSHDNTLVAAETLGKYLQAMECVKEENEGQGLFYIREGWRSPQEQVRLRKNYDAAKAAGENPAPVAFPCCSNHSLGTAMDINRLDGQKMDWDFNKSSSLTKCMNAVGLKAEIHPQEPWHWSPTGK